MKKFLFLFLVMFLSLALMACGETESDESAGSEEQEESTEEESSDKDLEEAAEDEETEESSVNYGIGDTAEFDDAKFTLKAVNTTDERNEFAETDPPTVIEIEYELENLSEEELAYGMDITVYDAEGNQMEPYPLDNSMGAIAPGKKVQGVEYHGIESTGTIEIHYAPIISFEDVAIFETEIE